LWRTSRPHNLRPVARARWRHRGGSISAEHGIGRSRPAELEHYKETAELAMMRPAKRALEPKGIMSPGKVVCA
jgi:FAD/FMN-containing dehydrogenase